MTGKRQPDFVCGARIQETKQDTLAHAHAKRFATPEHFVVQSCGTVSDLPAIVTRAQRGQGWLPVMGRNADFLVVVAGVASGLDNRETILARETGTAQIGMRHRVRVIPARAGGFGSKPIAAMAMSRYCWRSFFNRPVHC